MYKVNKRPMTLVELMISMSLVAIVLTALGYFFRQVDDIGRRIDKIEEKSFKMRFIENRLASVFPRTYKDGYFFTGGDVPGVFASGLPNLILSFDNCVNLDKRYASEVLGRIYVNNEAQLCLAIWPAVKRWEEGVQPPVRNEVLMENVDSIAMEFFIPPLRGKQLEGESKIDPAVRGTWVTEWNKEYKELPAIIRLKINQDLEYAFPLPHYGKPVIYDGAA